MADKVDMSIHGISGLKQYDGYIDEEWHPKLSTWEREYKVYSEMRDNDPIVGAMLHGIESLIRGLDWHVTPANDSPEALEAAKFLEECDKGTWTPAKRQKKFQAMGSWIEDNETALTD